MKSTKQLISLILSIIMVLSLFAGCGQTPNADTEATQPNFIETSVPTETIEPSVEDVIASLDIKDLWKQELLHANQLGIPMDKIEQVSVSGVEMMELLDWFVEYAAPDRLNDWQKQLPLVRKSSRELTRFEALVSLFLATEIVGGDYSGHNYSIHPLCMGINHDWDTLQFDWELFGGFHAYDSYYCGDIASDVSLDAAAYFYHLGHPSYFSGEYPFSLDPATNSFRFDVPPSYAEAVLSIVRLISSTDPNLFDAEPTPVEQEYLNMADVRREEIRTAVTNTADNVTGTVYYVSTNGSDKNNGRSPETPWATPQHAFKQALKPGDAVLLERGGSWTISPSEKWGLTSSTIRIPKGVTLGAYGTGDRPILRGDLEAANNPEFWELYAEEAGVKIWKAAQPVYYCPVIAFNEGESYASPIMPGMDENGQYLSADGSAFDITPGLRRDLQFCCLLDLTRTGVDVDIENGAITGTLYLRCDSGNPADVYESIHVPQTAAGLSLSTNASIDSLCLRYFSCNGAIMDGYDGEHSQSVSNCEVGWCGGLLKRYEENHPGVYVPIAAGGVLQCSSSNVRVTNSHIHHCGPFTLIVAIHNGGRNSILNYKDIYFADNLIEYCGSGIHMGDYSDMDMPGTKGFLSNFVFENNFVAHSGMGWVQDMLWQYGCGGSSPYLSAMETMDGAADNDGIYLRNNLFYKSSFALFSLSDYQWNDTPVNALPIFSGNTYVQSAHKPILQKNDTTEIYYPSTETMTDILGDQEGTLVVLNP